MTPDPQPFTEEDFTNMARDYRKPADPERKKALFERIREQEQQKRIDESFEKDQDGPDLER